MSSARHTEEDRKKVVDLTIAGHLMPAIAEQVELSINSVRGIISWAKRMGYLDDDDTAHLTEARKEKHRAKMREYYQSEKQGLPSHIRGVNAYSTDKPIRVVPDLHGDAADYSAHVMTEAELNAELRADPFRHIKFPSNPQRDHGYSLYGSPGAMTEGA